MTTTSIHDRPELKARSLGSGFTLTELLIVIVIVVALALLLGVQTSRFLDKARCAHCISNLRQIGVGAALVSADNEGRLPDRLEVVNSSRYPYSIGNYLYPAGVPNDGGCYSCRSASETRKSSLGASLGNSTQNGWLSYGINLACGYKDTAGNVLRYKIFQVPQPSKRMLAMESNVWDTTTDAVANGRWAPRHRGTPTANNKLGETGNILFMDGHAESRVMSMNPIDQKEWNDLGIWSQIQGRSNILQ